MADRVVLHIGTMKSGTTYLQKVLRGGALGPGSDAFYAGGSFGVQTAAVRGMMGNPARRRRRAWDRLGEQVQRREGVAVYSQEFLSFARRPLARELVASFDGIPVEVVVTVRDQHGAIPAQWQSFTRNRGLDDWGTYVRRLEAMGSTRHRGDPGSKAVKSFRRAQDVPGIIRRWTGHPGLTGLTVVVVPPSGAEPDELWRRFCRAARIDAAMPPQAASRANESLGYASCDALRRVNATLEELSKPAYERARRDLLDAWLPLRPDEDRPVLDRAGSRLAAELNAAILAAVRRRGVRLVGALEELPVTPARGAPEAIAGPPAEQVRRALETAWTTVAGGRAPGESPEELVAALGRTLLRRHGDRHDD